MEQWTDVRRAVLVEGLSKWAACRKFGIHWGTLQRILQHPFPPGYLRKQAAEKSVIASWLRRLGELIEANRDLPHKQRYTVKRMWNALCGEGSAGGYTTVTLDERQEDLDAWLLEYSEQRPHSGKYCFHRIPMQTFLDSLPLASQKTLNQAVQTTANVA